MKYFKAVLTAYNEALGADMGYTALMVKNPLHSRWNVLSYDKPRDLGELAEYVDITRHRHFGTKASESDLESIGPIYHGLRNDTVFDLTRLFSYAQVRQHQTHDELLQCVKGYAEMVNTRCVPPLSQRELLRIVRSIASYSWKNRESIIRNNRDRGAMGFETISPECHGEDRKDEIRKRQAEGGRYSAACKAKKTIEKIKDAKAQLLELGQKPTITAVAKMLNMQRVGISQRYRYLFDDI